MGSPPAAPYPKVCVCVYTQVFKLIARANVSREFLENDVLGILSFCIRFLNTF